MWFICYCKILFWTINICQKTLGHKQFFFFFLIISLSLLHISFYFFNNCSALAKKSVVLAPSKSFTYLLTIVTQGTQQWNFLITFVADKYLQNFFAEETLQILLSYQYLSCLHIYICLLLGEKNSFFLDFKFIKF